MSNSVTDPNEAQQPKLVSQQSTQQSNHNFPQDSMNLKRYEAALSVVEHILNTQTAHATAWYSRGDALANLGRYQDALDSFDQAIALNPDYTEAWTFRGIVLIHLERYEDALSSCEKALEIQPQHRDAWLFHGVALHRLGRYKQAYASYDRASNRQPRSFRRTLGEAWSSLLTLLKGSIAKLGAGTI